jgi:hypothetical protein
MLSIGRVVPLTLLEYLLIADCDSPRSAAACFSFIWCFSISVLAIRALTEGNTVFVAISQGMSNVPPDIAFIWENQYKDDVSHTVMTYVKTGFNSTSNTQTSFTRQDIRRNGEIKG